MEVAKIVLEYIKVLLWPSLISAVIFLFRREIRGVISGLNNISEMKIGSDGISLKAELAKKIIESKSKVDDTLIPTDIDSLFSILMDLPDKDLEFLEKIKSNVNFLPTTSNDKNRYNSLCNHGVFSLADNGAFLLTDLGKALIKEIDREF